MLVAFFIRLAPAVALPNLRDEFVINVAQLGLVTSLFMWPFALMQPVAGILTDAFGARRTVTIFLIMAGTGQLLFALAPTFPLALAGRALAGFGFSVLFVGASMIMAQWFRPREFATLTGLWTSVGNIGALTAAAPLGFLIAQIGWRGSFGLTGLTVLALALFVFTMVRNRPADLGFPSIAEIDNAPKLPSASLPLPLRQGVTAILRERNTWLLGGYGFTLFGTMTMTQGFLAVPYMMDVYHFSQQQAANYLTLWAVGLIIGCSLWGFAADRVFMTRKGVVFWGAIVYLLLWLLLAIQPEGLPSGVLLLAMFWGGFFAATWIPIYAQLRDFIPPQMLSTAMGVLNMFLWLGGALYQQVSGLILEGFADASGEAPMMAYRVVIWLALASVEVSIVLIGLSTEKRLKIDEGFHLMLKRRC